MRHLKSRIFILCAALAVLHPSGAEAAGGDTLSLRIAFPRNVSVIDRDFRGNGESIDSFVRTMQRLCADPSVDIREVTVTAAASPEGSFRNNEKLSVRRAKSILDCVLDGTGLSASQVTVRSLGENWEGLLDFLLKSDEPWAEETAAAIAASGVLSAPDAQKSASCKAAVRSIRGGAVWTWLENCAFERLRSAQGLVTVVTGPSGSVRDTLVILEERTLVHKDTVWHLTEPQVPEIRGFRKDSLFREPVAAIRSNLLLPLMNIGVEVPLSNRFSLGADWYCPWLWRDWVNDFFASQKYCAQLLFGSLEARWWLGRMHSKDAPRIYRLRGHSLGLCLHGGYYDFEYEWNGRQGEFAAATFDYLYSAPLGKGGAHFEFCIGAGVAWHTYRDYKVPTVGGHLAADGDRMYEFLPIPKACISICIPITAKDREK